MQRIHVPTGDLHCIGGWMAESRGATRGGVVVVHDVLGLDVGTRACLDALAGHGLTAIAPACFDRLELDVQLPAERAARGWRLAREVGQRRALADVAAAAGAIASAAPIGILGLGWGASIACLAAVHLGMPAVAHHPAGDPPAMPEDGPKAPLHLHFGRLDPNRPRIWIAQHRDRAGVRVFTHAAAADYHRSMAAANPADAAGRAWRRTLEFFLARLEAPE